MQCYGRSLKQFFDILYCACNSGDMPVLTDNFVLNSSVKERDNYCCTGKIDLDLINSNFSVINNYDNALLIAKEFSGISISAYTDFVYAWMSEFPVEQETINFGKKVILAARNSGKDNKTYNFKTHKAKIAVEKIVSDRGDKDVITVLNSSFKVKREIERLMGILRFFPFLNDMYAAKCSPDHFVLPALADYFKLRFGSAPWIIADEKRKIVLSCYNSNIEIIPLNDRIFFDRQFESEDKWEKLWKKYHTSINNEARTNALLQKQYMPVRYWKYLPEMKDKLS